MAAKKEKPETTIEEETVEEVVVAEPAEKKPAAKPPEKKEEHEEKKPEHKKSEGKQKDSTLLAAIGYPIGIIAIIMYLTRKDDKFLRFHSLQSILFWVAWIVIWIAFSVVSIILTIVTGGIFGICSGLLSLVLIVLMFVGCLYPAWKAYQDEEYELPVIGEIAKKHM